MIKNLVNAGIFFSMLALTGYVEPVKANEIKVVSYNVEFGAKSTPEQMGEYLKQQSPDIVGFSEVPNQGWTERVGKILGMEYAYVGKISSAHHRNKYKSILSRTPLENVGEIELDAPGRWNPASAVRAETTINGETIAIYSLHVAQASGHGHTSQLVDVALKNESTDHVLVMGDFNNNLGAHELDYLEEVGYRATWRDLDIDISDETSVVSREIVNRHGIIDHIFYRDNNKMQATNGGILYTSVYAALSDHHAIWAEIKFNK